MLSKSRRGIAPNTYYHIFNRGAHRQDIFRNQHDLQRFLFSLLYLQSAVPFRNIARITAQFTHATGFLVPLHTLEKIQENRFVDLVAFCLIPNHYHLLVQETREGGIASYMQRVQGGYTKYFDTKYNASGHVFQGSYKAVPVESDRQLMYLSSYIHRNPRELKEWKDKEETYPWSSLQDYITANRWGGLLATDIITSHFAQTPNSNYRDFVRTSTAKTIEDELGEFI